MAHYVCYLEHYYWSYHLHGETDFRPWYISNIFCFIFKTALFWNKAIPPFFKIGLKLVVDPMTDSVAHAVAVAGNYGQQLVNYGQ